MSSKPEIELALGVRSDERIVVISSRGTAVTYPESWARPTNLEELRFSIDPTSVVIVDGVDVTRRTFNMIGELSPRILAVAPMNEDHARSVRRTITSLYPWAEFWNINSSLGKLIVTKDAVGRAYDREAVIDFRPIGVVA